MAPKTDSVDLSPQDREQISATAEPKAIAESALDLLNPVCGGWPAERPSLVYLMLVQFIG